MIAQNHIFVKAAQKIFPFPLSSCPAPRGRCPLDPRACAAGTRGASPSGLPLSPAGGTGEARCAGPSRLRPRRSGIKSFTRFFSKNRGCSEGRALGGVQGQRPCGRSSISAPAGRAVSAQTGLELRTDGRDFCLPFARCSNADRVSRRARDHCGHQPQQVADRQMSASECRRPAKCRGK